MWLLLFFKFYSISILVFLLLEAHSLGVLGGISGWYASTIFTSLKIHYFSPTLQYSLAGYKLQTWWWWLFSLYSWKTSLRRLLSNFYSFLGNIFYEPQSPYDFLFIWFYFLYLFYLYMLWYSSFWMWIYLCSWYL